MGSAVICALGMGNVQNVGDVFYLKGFVFLFDKKDVSKMLQRGTARTVVGNWGQRFKLH